MAHVCSARRHERALAKPEYRFRKISKEQRAGEWAVWQTTLHNPDFSEYARICGALGIRVTDKADLDRALGRALAHDGPSLVEIICDAELV